MTGQLSQDQISSYKTNGYLVVREAVNGALVDELIATADAAAEALAATAHRPATASPTILSPGIELDDVASQAAGVPLIRRMKSPHLHHDAFAAALADPTLLDIVAQLIGENIRWHHTKVNAKQPNGSGQVEWHTDWGYYPHTNADLLEIAIALDPTTEANGCLSMLPGSHLGPARIHTENGRFVGAVPPGSFDHGQTVAIELEPGDISIHHVRLLHGSGPNRTDQQRRLLLQGYAAADAWPLMAQHQPNDWPEWNARLLRGHPTTAARLDGSPVEVPLPITEALGLFQTQAMMSVSHFASSSERGPTPGDSIS